MRELDRRTLVVGVVAVAPCSDRQDQREELDALLGQAVLVPLTPALLAVGHAAQDVVLEEQGQPVGEDLSRHRDVAAHVLEATDVVGHLAHHHERPSLAEHRHRATDRAVGGRECERGGRCGHDHTLGITDLRPVTVGSGLLTCEGTVIQRGRRTALARAQLTDGADKLVANATSTCMIFPAEG